MGSMGTGTERAADVRRRRVALGRALRDRARGLAIDQALKESVRSTFEPG